jgi:hypothetical protein
MNKRLMRQVTRDLFLLTEANGKQTIRQALADASKNVKPPFSGLKSGLLGSPTDSRSAEVAVAATIASTSGENTFVYLYGGRGGGGPGFTLIPGIKGLYAADQPSLQALETDEILKKKTREYIKGHKPDVMVIDNGEILDTEVKFKASGDFSSLPTASRTDYDFYVLVANTKKGNVVYAMDGAAYRKIAKSRADETTQDIDYSDIKKAKPQEAFETVEKAIQAVGMDNLANSIISAIMYRMMPKRFAKGAKATTLPFTIDGHKVRLDFKLESNRKLGKILYEEVKRFNDNYEKKKKSRNK